MAEAEIVSAGVVLQRDGQVLLVHRPKYDDWSFPKGKLERGEHVAAAAVREVAEETGLVVRLGPPLPMQRYLVGDRTKQVHYWTGRVVGDDDVTAYAPNPEIDQVAWLPIDEARARLSYPYDCDTLAQADRLRKKTAPVLVLRHARAHSRKAWQGDDRDRPLSEEGVVQAERLIGVLQAYGVERIVSSSSARCWQSLAPYADVADVDLEVSDALSEQDATPLTVSATIQRLIEANEPAVVCTHRPVLPWVFEALALQERRLEAGGVVVVHHRKGTVVAVEEHTP